MEYQYPFLQDWSTDEVIDVVHFFQTIERAYETGIKKDELMSAYRRFKEIIPGKADEKKVCNEFESSSNYSAYRTLQKAKQIDREDLIKM